MRVGIYQLMGKNWSIYCLMMGICYIEEMSKPTVSPQLKRYKKQTYHSIGFHSLRLKMKDQEVIDLLHSITLRWEQNKKAHFLGKTYKNPRKEKSSNQDQFFLSPLWLSYLLNCTGPLPNYYSYFHATNRIKNMKHYHALEICKEQGFLKLLNDKTLAAGAFLISMDLECKGTESGRVSLCMSEKYKDFLRFMLAVAKRWNWTPNNTLTPRNMNKHKERGINASPQYSFNLTIKALQEIYQIAGPLANSHKNNCVKFHVQRSLKYINRGGKNSRTKETLINVLKEKSKMSTTQLQFFVNVRTDVVLTHLKKLEKEGVVNKVRNGKRYLWSYRNSF